MIPGKTKTDPLARELENAVTALTDVSLAADRRNEEKWAEKDKDKNIDTLFPGSKLIKHGKLCHVPPKEGAESALPALYSLLANKKKNNSNQSII